MNLNEMRREIDLVDEQIVKLIDRRTQIAVEIGRLKAKAGLPIIDESRETEVIRRVCDDRNYASGRSITEIFKTILKESRAAQLRIAENLIKAGSETGK
ncbi:MAG: chorismate mutase [Pyrinomonadaceae bacterium]